VAALLRKPSALLPIGISLAAFVLIVGSVAEFGLHEVSRLG